MFQNPKDAILFQHLEDAKTIAVVGISKKIDRTSYLIAEQLQQAGYKIFPVNPMVEGEEILGEKVVASLSEIQEKIDIVDIFRRSEFLLDVAKDFVKANAKVFWAQSGLVSEEANEFLLQHNVPKENIIMDRCTKIELLRKNWEKETRGKEDESV